MFDYLAGALERERTLRVIFAGTDRGAAIRSIRTGVLRTFASRARRPGRLPRRVGEEALEALYESCDVLAMPSRSESFGLTLIEAMAHGKPVLASKLGSSQEIVEPGRTGQLVRVGATDDWADALVTLACSPDTRDAMGTAARQRFLQRYEQHVMVDAVERFYHEVVARGSASQ